VDAKKKSRDMKKSKEGDIRLDRRIPFLG
jgi:hypothetical protein